MLAYPESVLMSGRILVVEDEAELADFLLRGLREEGFAVDHEANGLNALRRLQHESWDLALLDWRLPGLSGLEVLRQLRLTSDELPILVLTARDSVSDRVLGLNTGADDYLCKPFAFDELLARVRALTRRNRGRARNVLEHQDVCVNILTRRAERAGVPLSLTAKEEALLIYFLRHPGEVLTRARIFEQVWDDRYDHSSNTIEVHIRNLRGKLEAGGRSRLIHTLRHRGYVFGDPE